jgi:pyruvate/2-oxoglutarate dehydrogenase complex dihydrolipoamide dehydrogenase (E3) component
LSGKGSLPHSPGMGTSVRGIYVVGDAAGPPYLAHKAMAQALRAVDHMLGNPRDRDQEDCFSPSDPVGDIP